jgi:hypothetical protein
MLWQREACMQGRPAGPLCCGRCAGAQAAARVARRQHFRAAVFARPGGGLPGAEAMAGAERTAGTDHGAGSAGQFRTVSGTLVDVSPHILVVATGEGERRLALAPGGPVWRGRLAEATELRPGEGVTVRLAPGRRDVAEGLGEHRPGGGHDQRVRLRPDHGG